MNPKLNHPVVRAVYEYLLTCGAIECPAKDAIERDVEVCAAVVEHVLLALVGTAWRHSLATWAPTIVPQPHPGPSEPGRERVLGERVIALEAAVQAVIEQLGPVPERNPDRQPTQREQLLWQLDAAMRGAGGIVTRAT